VSDPIPVIPLDYAPRVSPKAIWLHAKFWIPASWAVALIAWLLIAFVDVESVLITAPVLVACGLFIFISGSVRRDSWWLCLGICHCAICLLLVGLVNVLHWSPQEAHHPFLWIGGLYVTAMAAPTARATLQRPST
jgi:hypothetical protein